MSQTLLHICQAALTAKGTLPTTLFLAGLAGSVTHCAGMCGPFVLSQTASRLDDVPLHHLSYLTRLKGAALIPYHAGRMTTYVMLGSLAALFSSQIRSSPWFTYFSATLLIFAGVVFLWNALPFVRPALPMMARLVPKRVMNALQALFARPTGGRGYLLGCALGFLPCGLVYAAIISVAAKGDPLTAAIGMIAFAAGTVPVLFMVGIGGHFAFHRFRSSLRYVFPLLMTFNSLALFAMAGDLIR